MANIFKSIFNFYYEWFKNLTSLSKKLWLLIFIKTAIVLTVLIIFFPDKLGQYNTDAEKSDAVSNSLLNIN